MDYDQYIIFENLETGEEELVGIKPIESIILKETKNYLEEAEQKQVALGNTINHYRNLINRTR